MYEYFTHCVSAQMEFRIRIEMAEEKKAKSWELIEVTDGEVYTHPLALLKS